ncbi:DEAD/DEAH box helicase family protein [Synechococcus sp. UW140]|uniref:DEAD/DEAH box helicase family protein n=1 Tax=Synechococcus sp. UW140 TaxID=368503 RepID=UPI000E0E8300|nr:DEAD/DEAH box helicase family protein [Synechococcus sp. UW140]
MNNQQSQYGLIAKEWPELCKEAEQVEAFALNDPRTACFYARRTVELMVEWIYEYDSTLRRPYETNLSSLIHNYDFRELVGPKHFERIKYVKNLGNDAVHKNEPIKQAESVLAASEIFQVLRWLALTYGRNAQNIRGLRFDKTLLPKGGQVFEQTRQQLAALADQLAERDQQLRAAQAESSSHQIELEHAKKELEALKAVNQAQQQPEEDLTEFQTRQLYIDHYLEETGWRLDHGRSDEVEVNGMPNETGEGFVDYVLWGDDGKPLALVEAKRTSKDPKIGQQQAKLYADCLEQQFGQRPIIFLSNGYRHLIWDDINYPPRDVQGFYKKDELELLIRRRDSIKPLQELNINKRITERYYQERAIRCITESLEKKHRKSLLVMATGTGKTRTVISLCDLLIRSNWVKRILFLADRTALVNQAEKAFKEHLPDCSPVNLVTNRHGEGRVFLSTYPTILNLIDSQENSGQRRFGVGHFDLVVIDEAHRSVYQKYGAIFDYFDSLLVGLTATPKDEVDKNTYRLFGLDVGMPTDEYGLDQAIEDKYLTPFRAISVPLRFVRDGIRYDELSDEDKAEWDEIDWDEGQTTPTTVESGAINKWLFNTDTVDKVLEHLLTHGQRAEDSDRIGKTIIFAKNHDHAVFIQERFDANYPHLIGRCARVIDNRTTYAQSLIDEFSDPANPLDIAISVDMLDTGIDVPEIVNLIFFKLVRSKTKFWQMLGRGTRLCPDLFGPGEDKSFFWIFDYCQNLEFFLGQGGTESGSNQETMATKLFKIRLDLLLALDQGGHRNTNLGFLTDQTTELPKDLGSHRAQIAGLLKAEVSSCNPDNFLVRPHLQMVERFSNANEWNSINEAARNELSSTIAYLPFGQKKDDPDARRFDLLLYKLQIAHLQNDSVFLKLQQQVQEIAGLLVEKETIPMVLSQLPLIQEIQTNEWWQDINPIMLENVRRKLRSLIGIIEKKARKPVYTDFEDQIGEGSEIDSTHLITNDEFRKFRLKTRNILQQYQDNLTIQRLRRNQALTASDLIELEQFLLEHGAGSQAMLNQIKEEDNGLGIFVRSLIGLDRKAAKEVFSEFLTEGIYNSTQIQFINEIINYLTQYGVMEPEMLYQAPFTDMAPEGPEQIFQPDEVDKICNLMAFIRSRASYQEAA